VRARARDLLRLEKCYPLNGSDLSESTTPWEAGLAFAVDLGKNDFMGADALRAQRARGVDRRLTALKVEGKLRLLVRGIRSMAAEADSQILGTLTSGGFSPGLDAGIAMALSSRPAQHPEGVRLWIEIRGKRYPAGVGRKTLHLIMWLMLRFAAVLAVLLEGAAAQTVSTKPLGEVLPDAKTRRLDKPQPAADPELARYAIYARDAPTAEQGTPVSTALPLVLAKGEHIVFIGNTLFDRDLEFGYFESMLQQANPSLELVVRNLSWSADALTVQPRPENFAATEQLLLHEKADTIVAAFGFNEAFAGPDGLADFRQSLITKVSGWKASRFNGKSGPHIVLVSPIANENVAGVAAADRNNGNLRLYTAAMREVARETQVGFVDVCTATEQGMKDEATALTINGCHLNSAGYQLFANVLFQGIFGSVPPGVDEEVRKLVIDKNRQFFRRYRPLNTFYYTGGRKETYGYLDFLPAMRSFEIMTGNRDAAIHALVQGGKAGPIDDSNVPEMPPAQETIGANEWLRASDELAAFRIDPRFEVSLFAGRNSFLRSPTRSRSAGTASAGFG